MLNEHHNSPTTEIIQEAHPLKKDVRRYSYIAFDIVKTHDMNKGCLLDSMFNPFVDRKKYLRYEVMPKRTVRFTAIVVRSVFI